MSGIAQEAQPGSNMEIYDASEKYINHLMREAEISRALGERYAGSSLYAFNQEEFDEQSQVLDIAEKYFEEEGVMPVRLGGKNRAIGEVDEEESSDPTYLQHGLTLGYKGLKFAIQDFGIRAYPTQEAELAAHQERQAELLENGFEFRKNFQELPWTKYIDPVTHRVAAEAREAVKPLRLQLRQANDRYNYDGHTILEAIRGARSNINIYASNDDNHSMELDVTSAAVYTRREPGAPPRKLGHSL